MRPSFIHRALDGMDRSVEPHTIFIIAAFVCLVVFQGYALIKGQDFSAYAFGQALGVVMGGGSVAAIGQGYLNRTPNFKRGPDFGLNTPRPDDPDGAK